MRVPYERARGTIRFSLSRYNTTDEIDHTLSILPRIIRRQEEESGV